MNLRFTGNYGNFGTIDVQIEGEIFPALKEPLRVSLRKQARLPFVHLRRMHVEELLFCWPNPNVLVKRRTCSTSRTRISPNTLNVCSFSEKSHRKRIFIDEEIIVPFYIILFLLPRGHFQSGLMNAFIFVTNIRRDNKISRRELK